MTPASVHAVDRRHQVRSLETGVLVHDHILGLARLDVISRDHVLVAHAWSDHGINVLGKVDDYLEEGWTVEGEEVFETGLEILALTIGF